MTAFIVLIAVLTSAAITTVAITGWIEEYEAADAAWAELPIYKATAAHIARFAAEDIDRDWAEMNGGAS